MELLSINVFVHSTMHVTSIAILLEDISTFFQLSRQKILRNIPRASAKMVVFICNACGNSVKKSRVEKHYQTECPGCSVLSCIDCGKDFTGEEYQAHTSCISEAEKYQGKLFTESDRTKSNKGERKQQEWLQVRS